MRTLATVILVLALATSVSSADVDPFVSGGVGIGAGIHEERDNGLLLGLEVSGGGIVSSSESQANHGEFLWFGGYLDLQHDFGAGATRFSIGPEVGWSIVALDLGLVREFGDAGAFGFAVRPGFSIGFATLFLRYTYFGGDDRESSDIQFGVLVKFPYVPSIKW